MISTSNDLNHRCGLMNPYMNDLTIYVNKLSNDCISLNYLKVICNELNQLSKYFYSYFIVISR